VPPAGRKQVFSPPVSSEQTRGERVEAARAHLAVDQDPGLPLVLAVAGSHPEEPAGAVTRAGGLAGGAPPASPLCGMGVADQPAAVACLWHLQQKLHPFHRSFSYNEYSLGPTMF